MEILVSRTVNPFHSPKKSLGTLNADVVAKLISSAADIALVVDKSGVIRDVAIGSEDLSKAGLGEWAGVSWADTVTSDSRHKVEELMREAALNKPTRWREVNHIARGGEHVPVRYSISIAWMYSGPPSAADQMMEAPFAIRLSSTASQSS